MGCGSSKPERPDSDKDHRSKRGDQLPPPLLPKIELHLHLDAAVKFDTIADLAKQKSILLPSYDPVELKEFIITTWPGPVGFNRLRNAPKPGLTRMQSSLKTIISVLCGDPEGIERIAYELCQEQAKRGVIYFEARFTPHLLSNTEKSAFHPIPLYKERGDLTPEGVLQRVLHGLKRGEVEFGIKWGVILSCLGGYPVWSREIFELCKMYKDNGVVGIDYGGCVHSSLEIFDHVIVEIFQKAKHLGIHRTVHAGESGSAESVESAMDDLYAERIGHGYKVVDEEKRVYYKARANGVHFEFCPLSSTMTGAADDNFWEHHPIRRFLIDKGNFSISTDVPSLLGNNMESELDLCRSKMGFIDYDLLQCQINAAKAAFLPQVEKNKLIDKLRNGWPKFYS